MEVLKLNMEMGENKQWQWRKVARGLKNNKNLGGKAAVTG